jgi:hypothetical protein
MSISHVTFHIRGYLATWDTHRAKCIFFYFFIKKEEGIFSHLPLTHVAKNHIYFKKKKKKKELILLLLLFFFLFYFLFFIFFNIDRIRYTYTYVYHYISLDLWRGPVYPARSAPDLRVQLVVDDIVEIRRDSERIFPPHRRPKRISVAQQRKK